MSASVVKYSGRNVAQQTGTQPLHMTTFGLQGGFAEVARVLLEAGADVNATELNGRTTLHHAAIRNAYKVFDVLLEFGCDLDPIRFVIHLYSVCTLVNICIARPFKGACEVLSVPVCSTGWGATGSPRRWCGHDDRPSQTSYAVYVAGKMYSLSSFNTRHYLVI